MELPRPISALQRRARLERVRDLARRFGFVGTVNYLHVATDSGGAQYWIGPAAPDDFLVVYPEAFERDADPEDFSLEAMIAHECGHQMLVRDPRLRPVIQRFPGERFEHVLASIVGSLLVDDRQTAQMLVWKATVEVGQLRVSPEASKQLVERFRHLLRDLI
jgi:hypothetical protein